MKVKVDSALFGIAKMDWSISIIRCYHGDYENGKGYRLDEGKIVYSGGFQQKKRHGQGISYHDNGEKEFVGTFVDDDPQEGKKFRKNGTLLFEGEMDGNMFYRGSLYNHTGQLSFKGLFTNGACIAGTWFNSNGIIHTGHANDFPPISTFAKAKRKPFANI
jgi:antitoxin component YwqK of YwqJK toxin-antitoxin module